MSEVPAARRFIGGIRKKGAHERSHGRERLVGGCGRTERLLDPRDQLRVAPRQPDERRVQLFPHQKRMAPHRARAAPLRLLLVRDGR